MQALLGTLLLGLAIGLARGGSLRALAEANLRWFWLLFAALALQLLANVPSGDLGWLAFAMLIGSYLAVAAFAGANITTTGMPLVAVGAGLNALVIAVNHGMPVSAQALAAIGERTDLAMRGKHFVDHGTASLRFLSDVIAWRLRPRIISVGDIVAWTGIAVLIQDLMVHPKRARVVSRSLH